jgi:tRNA-dihydrouridine synthase B
MLKQLRYGPNLTLPDNILYAPLAGCTDVPMRLMSAKYRPALQFCEMLKMDALVRRHPGTLAMAAFTDEMFPIGAQLVGSKPEIAGDAACIVKELGFPMVDLNCGCPVDKVTKDGSGSGLLKNPEKIGQIVTEIRKAVDLPVSVKVRLGWDDSSVIVDQLVRIAEDSGAVAITIHGRTREQGYSGAARWELIRQAKQAARSIYVIGNGDLFCPEDVARMFEQTGVDGVLIARGTMGAPWIAEQTRDHLSGRPYRQRTVADRLEALREHFALACRWFPEKKALLDLRRFGAWYLKSASRMRQIRHQLNGIETIAEANALLDQVQRDALEAGEVDSQDLELVTSCEGV